MRRLGLVLMIGSIILGNSHVATARQHADAVLRVARVSLVHPTEVSVVFCPKDVRIADADKKVSVRCPANDFFHCFQGANGGNLFALFARPERSFTPISAFADLRIITTEDAVSRFSGGHIACDGFKATTDQRVSGGRGAVVLQHIDYRILVREIVMLGVVEAIRANHAIAIMDWPNVSAKLISFVVGRREPLLARIPRGETSSDHSEEHKQGGRLVEPMFGFGLGVALCGLGSWWFWFTARHRGPSFIVLGAVTLVAGWLTIALADVVQSAIGSLFASSALAPSHFALPNRLGIGV